MGESLIKGYSDVWGKHAAAITDHVGPTSYVKGGETLSLPSPIGLRTIDVLCPEGISFSGNYKVVAQSPGTQGALKNTAKLLWYPTSQAAVTDSGTLLSLGPLSASSTNSAVVAHVGTVTVSNSLVPGNFVYLSAFTQMAALNGTIVKVVSASPTQFTFNLGSAAALTSGADTTGKFQLIQAAPSNLLQVATSSSAITNSLSTSSLLTMTCANSFAPGNFVYIDGLTNGATANGYIAQVATASATQFTAVWTGTSFTTAADAGTATLIVTNGQAPIFADYTTNVTNSLATASSAGTAGVVTLTATNAFYAGNLVMVKGLTNGAAVNGDILVANSSTTGLLLVANHQTAAFSTAADVGSLSLLLTGAPTDSGEVAAGTNLSGETVRILAIGG
jgi:hypothetical protein